MTPSHGDDEKIEKLYIDMYVGNGPQNPSITARLLLVEEAVKKTDRLFWAVVVMLIAVLGDIIKHSLK